MKNYDTVLEALNDLKKRGYSIDLNLSTDCIHCPQLDLKLHPEDFIIKEVYRFEGMSDPGDNSVIYAIESSGGIKGVLLDAYGMYSESLSPELVAKLRIKKDVV